MVTLIPKWQEAWRLWSVRLAALGSLLWGHALAFPDHLLILWTVVPDEVREFLPPRLDRWSAFLLFAGVIIARLIRQRKADG